MAQFTVASARNLMDELRQASTAPSVMQHKAVEVLLREARAVLAQEPTLVRASTPRGGVFRVVGDTHGQFFDLCRILDTFGEPSYHNQYVFNGDFVDRGSWGVEVLLCLLAWKLACPTFVHLTRGNHESQKMTQRYGFAAEAVYKYSERIYQQCLDVFQALPLALLLDARALVLHGGLFSRPSVRLQHIQAIDRFREPPSGVQGDLLMELLWSDPMSQPGIAANRRGGATIMWGPDVTAQFLCDNNLELIVRSHEVCQNGYELHHDERVVTVFSAPNYVDRAGNLGAVLEFRDGWKAPKAVTFSAADHPSLKPMAYLDLGRSRL